ncbi:FabD/lysophospholipase-like protein [Ceratobasidium sp. AG-I]|nr:FabD/lysophospholipase-like protein [Ceratobasidium sp. AG-I]
MPPRAGEPGVRILEFDGGGINVLSALIIVWEIMRRVQAIRSLVEMPLPCEIFDLIYGTGTGGLVAILLGRLRLPITDAIECYVDILNRGFVKKGLGIRLGTDDTFRATALEAVIGDIVARHCRQSDARMIQDQDGGGGCKVMVCAMSADAMRGAIPTCIRTYRVAANQGPDCTIVQAVRATMATPGMFKRAWIEEHTVKAAYIGGGLGCNNPTAQAIDEVDQVFPGRTIQTIISVGSGQLRSASVPERRRLSQFLPSNLIDTLGSIATDCERTNQELSRRFSRTPNAYFRFNTEHGMQDTDQSDPARLSQVRAHTETYLKDAVVTANMDRAVRSTEGKGEAVIAIERGIQLPSQPIFRVGRCPPPSRAFTGREDILNQMDHYFSSPGSLERRLFVLHGLGGAGKTQLALKFVQSHKHLFSNVFYLDATTRETVSAGLAALVKAAQAGTMPEDGLPWLASQEEQWLLVLNNADDPELNLHDFFPQCAHGDILITTRNQQMVAHTTGLESECRVGGMKPDDALQLLLKTSRADDREETIGIAKQLVGELGYFALAIVQSGAYMRTRQCGVPEYYRIFQDARARMLRQHPSVQADDYGQSVFATWEISYRQLLPRVAQLLHIMSFWHHEGISEAFFEAASTRTVSYELHIALTESQAATKTIIFDFLSSLRTSSGNWDTLALKDLTDQLRAYSLLDYDTQSCSYSMHPLVQEWSRTTAPDSGIARECSPWVLSLCVKMEYSSEDYAFRRRLLPHLVALGSDHMQMVPELAYYLNLVYEEAGYPKEAEALLAIALHASRDALGNKHNTTLACMHNLASAFQDQGRLEEAVGLLTEVVEVRKRVRGHEHPDTLTSMHNLAYAYRDQERWQEAEALFLEVIEARKRVIGAEHSHTLVSMQQLASTYHRQGRLSEAEALEVEVLKTKQRVLGREHPNTLVAMFNLAVTFEAQGKLQEAESLMEEVVNLSKKVLGELHVETQEDIQSLDRIQQRIRSEL